MEKAIVTQQSNSNIKNTVGWKVVEEITNLPFPPHLGFHYSYEKPKGEFDELNINLEICKDVAPEDFVKMAASSISSAASRITNLLDVSSVEFVENEKGNKVLKAKIYRPKY